MELAGSSYGHYNAFSPPVIKVGFLDMAVQPYPKFGLSRLKSGGKSACE
jgi:hypothetical protein